MNRLLLGAALVGALSLVLAACGGEASGDDAEATAPAEWVTAEESEPVEESESVEESEPVEAEPADEAVAKKSAKKKKAQKKAAQKKRQVAVALGDPSEFDLVPAKPKVRAGMVTFKLKNTGSIEHELIVIRTDLDSGELPTDENGAAMEHGAVAPHHTGQGDGAEHAGAHVGTHVLAGGAESVTLELKPGSYALVCNLPGHYASGMHSNFTVAS